MAAEDNKTAAIGKSKLALKTPYPNPKSLLLQQDDKASRPQEHSCLCDWGDTLALKADAVNAAAAARTTGYKMPEIERIKPFTSSGSASAYSILTWLADDIMRVW